MTPWKFVLALVLAAPVAAQEAPSLTIFDAKDADLASFQWVARPVVVFADSPFDPRFEEQMKLLEARPRDMIDRDVVIITDTDPAAKTELRQDLRPRGFMLVLIGKDGGIKLRKPTPWSTRELGRTIDKMPMRQREIRERSSGAG